MLRNYWKIAVRNLIRYRGFSAINIFGLALGMGSFLLICLHLAHEWSFDTFHEDHRQRFRVVQSVESGPSAGNQVVPVNWQLSNRVSEVIPEVDASVTLLTFGRQTIRHEEVSAHEPFAMASANFFEFFSFPLLDGDPATALLEPAKVVLSRQSALRYFGHLDVVGEMLEVGPMEVEITGLMDDFPDNSHLKFDFLFSLASTRLAFPDWDTRLENDYNSNNFTTYVHLVPGSDRKSVEGKITDWVTGNWDEEAQGSGTFWLQPLADIHLNSAGFEEEYHELPGNPRYLNAFVIAAFFILLLASINYTNLATALATRRSREVGMRKVLGSQRNQLIFQFLTESLVLSTISLFIGFSLVQLALPGYNQWTGKELTLNMLDWEVYALLAGIVVGVSLLAGSYPALFLSRFSPAVVLKGQRTQRRRLGVREVLVVIQFGISGLLVIATAIMYHQLRYLENKDLGFEKDQHLVVDINSRIARSQFEEIKLAFTKLPSVEVSSVSSRVPGEWKNFPMAQVEHPDHKEEQLDMIYLAADWDFLETYDIDLVKGRNFSRERNDSATVLINTRAAQLLGISEVNEQVIEIPSVRFGARLQQGEEAYQVRVIGIVNDFHFEDLRQSLKPMIISYYNNPYHSIDYYTLKISMDDPQQVVREVTAAYASIDPDEPVEYHFLDEQWEDKYRSDTRNGQLIAGFSGLAVLIACMGLFALASLTIQYRLKEVAIRKVLGGTRRQLVATLSWSFIKLVGIAIVLSLPLGIWVTRSWLATFAYRAQLSWVLLGGLALLLVLLALGTVSLRTLRAANQNPVKALRNE